MNDRDAIFYLHTERSSHRGSALYWDELRDRKALPSPSWGIPKRLQARLDTRITGKPTSASALDHRVGVNHEVSKRARVDLDSTLSQAGGAIAEYQWRNETLGWWGLHRDKAQAYPKEKSSTRRIVNRRGGGSNTKNAPVHGQETAARGRNPGNQSYWSNGIYLASQAVGSGPADGATRDQLKHRGNLNHFFSVTAQSTPITIGTRLSADRRLLSPYVHYSQGSARTQQVGQAMEGYEVAVWRDYL